MLARGGAAPLLIERSEKAHDLVCGAFLGWDALGALEKLGVDALALGARPIHQLRLFAGKRSALVSLPHAAAGLSRRRLDEAMLAQARAAGAAIERGVTAQRVDGLAIALRDGGAIEAEALFLATGKHDLRGLARPREATGGDPAVGLRLALPSSPALARTLDGVIELHLFDRGYAGLLMQEDGTANLCLSVAASRLAEAGGKADALLASLAAESPALAERVGAGTRGGWLAVAGVPYGWRAQGTSPGLFRLGDQTAVIASLAGDGVAIALGSGREAAEHYLRHGPAGAMAYQRAFSRRAARPLGVAGVLRRLGESPLLAPPLTALFGRLPAGGALLARLTRIGG